MAPKNKAPHSVLQECHEAIVKLRKTTSVEAILKKIDYLIEKIFIAKAEISCHFDRQFVIDSSKTEYELEKIKNKALDDKKRLRILCLNFIYTLAEICHKRRCLGEIVSRLITIIRLETTLLQLAQNDTDHIQPASQLFPGCLLEYMIGLVLYSNDHDVEIVDGLVNDYLFSTPDLTYHSYTALDNIQKNFDTSQIKIYKNEKINQRDVFERFVQLVLRIPKPHVSYQMKMEAHGKVRADKGGANTSEGYNSDSDSTIGYSDESEDEDNSDEYESEMEYEIESETEENEQGTGKYDCTKVYSSLWQGIIFASATLPKKIVACILNRMPSDILPYTKNPLVYSNWLMGHLNGKEKILSMLSLKSIFELILNYGLGELEELHNNLGGEQASSAIYERIYMNLNDETIASEFGRDFLQFLNMALKSVMLPSQLTACFIKKLVRTACLTMCMDSTVLLTMAVNLLKVHNHTCLGVIHRDNIRGLKGKRDTTSMDKLTLSVTNGETQSEEDMLYIWEVPLLVNHFNERTATMASTFYSDLKKKRGVLLTAEDIIGCECKEHLMQEIKRARREDGGAAFRKTLQQTTQLAKEIFV
ncbi:CBF Mak21 family protein, putative [Babesia ovis]|uniref:CBF Mak21 family protein, putative n=1 Tax=Babesia ovis TaxID=5869 RepID=A0A9W5WVC5_BABOV|nr:CBF Mak21 family protein, putative [Babesia ovis]